jgi:hypothetical protein
VTKQQRYYKKTLLGLIIRKYDNGLAGFRRRKHQIAIAQTLTLHHQARKQHERKATEWQTPFSCAVRIFGSLIQENMQALIVSFFIIG